MSTATLFGIHLTGAPLLLTLLVLVLAMLIPLFRSPGPELAGPEVVEDLEGDEGLDDLDVPLVLADEVVPRGSRLRNARRVADNRNAA